MRCSHNGTVRRAVRRRVRTYCVRRTNVGHIRDIHRTQSLSYAGRRTRPADTTPDRPAEGTNDTPNKATSVAILVPAPVTTGLCYAVCSPVASMIARPTGHLRTVGRESGDAKNTWTYTRAQARR